MAVSFVLNSLPFRWEMAGLALLLASAASRHGTVSGGGSCCCCCSVRINLLLPVAPPHVFTLKSSRVLGYASNCFSLFKVSIFCSWEPQRAADGRRQIPALQTRRATRFHFRNTRGAGTANQSRPREVAFFSFLSFFFFFLFPDQRSI